MKEIINRLRSETPKFWKKVRNICTAAGGTAMAIYGYSYYAQLPPIAVDVAKICACMGFFGTFLSQLNSLNADENK